MMIYYTYHHFIPYIEYPYIKRRMEYDGLITRVYYDPGGYETVQETYKEKLDSTNTMNNVRDWYERYIDRKTA